MYLKVLLADDEVLARNHLRSLIPWERHGYTICGEAEDGQAAVRMIAELQPDIVVIDINMPHMDGVQLAGYLHENHPVIKMIVLSSYDDYDFVRQTLQYSAVDYLLKHRVKAAELLQVLGTAKERLNVEERRKREELQSHRRWEMASPIVAQNDVKDLILGSPGNLERIREHFGSSGPDGHSLTWALVVMQIVNYDLVISKFSDIEAAAYQRSIIEICRQATGDDRQGCTVYLDKGRFARLIMFRDTRSEMAFMQSMETLLRRTEQSLDMFMHVKAVAEYSPPLYQLRQVADHYPVLAGKLDQKVGTSPLLSRKSADQEPPLVSITIREEKTILSMMEIGDKTELGAAIHRIFEKLLHQDYHTKQRIVMELLHIGVKIGRKVNVDTGWIFEEMQAIQKQLDVLERTEKLVMDIFDSIVDQWHSTRTNYSVYVEQAVQLIKQHYREGLSLEQCAERIGITPPYLSRLFKEETGMNFTEFINHYRIELSKRLIEDGDHKIKEMYMRVGFNNYSYFIKVFKELVGETPMTFARRRSPRRG